MTFTFTVSPTTFITSIVPQILLFLVSVVLLLGVLGALCPVRSDAGAFVRDLGLGGDGGYVKRGRVLVVTAHPDDESMFFGPLILELVSAGVGVDVLCLSTGDADGLGEERSRELLEACVKLGVEVEGVTCLDDATLRDGMGEEWREEDVGDVVVDHVAMTKPVAIVTFDAHGVSSHPNHIDTHRGVLRMVKEWPSRHSTTSLPTSPPLFLLETVPVWRKFLGRGEMLFHTFFPLFSSSSTPIHPATPPYLYYFPTSQADTITNAMLQHKTQLVWFRWLYLLTSSYLFLNTIIPARIK